jgi:hypothetical protein
VVSRSIHQNRLEAGAHGPGHVIFESIANVEGLVRLETVKLQRPVKYLR